MYPYPYYNYNTVGVPAPQSTGNFISKNAFLVSLSAVLVALLIWRYKLKSGSESAKSIVVMFKPPTPSRMQIDAEDIRLAMEEEKYNETIAEVISKLLQGGHSREEIEKMLGRVRGVRSMLYREPGTGVETPVLDSVQAALKKGKVKSLKDDYNFRLAMTKYGFVKDRPFYDARHKDMVTPIDPSWAEVVQWWSDNWYALTKKERQKNWKGQKPARSAVAVGKSRGGYGKMKETNISAMRERPGRRSIAYGGGGPESLLSKIEQHRRVSSGAG